MAVTLDSTGPTSIERHARESYSDQDRSDRWRDYSVEFGNESGPIASLSHGTGHGRGPSPIYGRAGWGLPSWSMPCWSLHGLSKG
jgi:hypothetical protein